MHFTGSQWLEVLQTEASLAGEASAGPQVVPACFVLCPVPVDEGPKALLWAALLAANACKLPPYDTHPFVVAQFYLSS